MKIVVVVQQVEDLQWDLGEVDMVALEAALQLREAAGHGEIVVAAVSDPDVRDGLLTALALGADRAVLVAHDALNDLDALAVARLLSGVVKRESPDLVLSAAEPASGWNGAAAIALAGFLNLPRVAMVRKIEPDRGRGAVTAERAVEGGLVELVEVRTPAVVTVRAGTYRARYATLHEIQRAFGKPIEVLTVEDLGVNADTLAAVSGARLVSRSPAPHARTAEMIDGGRQEIATRIAAIINGKVG